MPKLYPIIKLTSVKLQLLDLNRWLKRNPEEVESHHPLATILNPFVWESSSVDPAMEPVTTTVTVLAGSDVSLWVAGDKSLNIQSLWDPIYCFPKFELFIFWDSLTSLSWLLCFWARQMAFILSNDISRVPEIQYRKFRYSIYRRYCKYLKYRVG